VRGAGGFLVRWDIGRGGNHVAARLIVSACLAVAQVAVVVSWVLAGTAGQCARQAAMS
jgi:hypothetical protein